MKKLSIIIPAYNEERTIDKVLKSLSKIKLFGGVTKEVIVIDDGSTDKTVSKVVGKKGIKLVKHKENLGKGMAVITGIKKAIGDYIIIQDADLEYNPRYINGLLAPVLSNKAEVVYGTRLDRLPNLSKEEKTFQFLLHYIGNRTLSLLTSILYGQWITDMETGYKLIPRRAFIDMNLHAKRFEFEPEITAKLLKKGYLIEEVSISTIPRGYDEGKKLNTVRDGIKALWAIIKYRFVD